LNASNNSTLVLDQSPVARRHFVEKDTSKASVEHVDYRRQEDGHGQKYGNEWALVLRIRHTEGYTRSFYWILEDSNIRVVVVVVVDDDDGV